MRTLAHLQGIAIGRKDVQYLLSVPGDVLEWRPGLQRRRRSEILALSGRTLCLYHRLKGPLPRLGSGAMLCIPLIK